MRQPTRPSTPATARLLTLAAVALAATMFASSAEATAILLNLFGHQDLHFHIYEPIGDSWILTANPDISEGSQPNDTSWENTIELNGQHGFGRIYQDFEASGDSISAYGTIDAAIYGYGWGNLHNEFQVTFELQTSHSYNLLGYGAQIDGVGSTVGVLGPGIYNLTAVLHSTVDREPRADGLLSDQRSFDFTLRLAEAVPEPGSALTLLGGFVCMGIGSWRRRTLAAPPARQQSC